jgi:hypothetical protein
LNGWLVGCLLVDNSINLMNCVRLWFT